MNKKEQKEYKLRWLELYTNLPAKVLVMKVAKFIRRYRHRINNRLAHRLFSFDVNQGGRWDVSRLLLEGFDVLYSYQGVGDKVMSDLLELFEGLARDNSGKGNTTSAELLHELQRLTKAELIVRCIELTKDLSRTRAKLREGQRSRPLPYGY